MTGPVWEVIFKLKVANSDKISKIWNLYQKDMVWILYFVPFAATPWTFFFFFLVSETSDKYFFKYSALLEAAIFVAGIVKLTQSAQ